MKIIPNKVSKIDFIRQIITCLLAIILFLTMLSSVAKPGPKGKAVGHNNIHGNGPIPMVNGRVNPAGIIIGSGGVKINGAAAAKHGNTSNQSGMSAFNPANIAVNHAGNNVFLMLNSQGNGVLGNMNKGAGAGGKKLTLAAGDVFSNGILNVGSLSASLTLPDPIGAKGPNPTHGGSHPKKGGGNPGGGNGNGHWGWGNHGNGKGNSYMGNQGQGVGEGMAGPYGPLEPPEPPEPPEEPDNPEPLYVEAAPLPKEQKPGIEKCPALKELAAQELGMTTDDIQIHLENVLADCYDIQPCDMYARLVNSASSLRDIDGSAIAALAKVINELASPVMPISEEYLASISQKLAFYNGDNDKPHYKLAGQWLDALAEYVSILTTEMQWSVDESIAFVGNRYVVPVMEEGDVSLAMFLHLQLQALGSS